MSNEPTAPKDDAQSVLADARWLPTHLDRSRAELEFRWLPREAQAAIPFLTSQYIGPTGAAAVRLKLSALPEATRSAARPVHYIFHSAFCCSTLIARALDLPGVAIGLKEPQILNELAATMRSGQVSGELLDRVTALLGRPFGPGEAVVVKPSNEANGLIEPLLRNDQRSKAVFLYAPLGRFLRSVAAKGMWGRIWGRRLLASLRQASPGPFGFDDGELFQQTDLQIAALAWLLHFRQFAELQAKFSNRVRYLDSVTFLANRSECLLAIGEHLGLELDAAGWARVSQGKVFGEHSKQIGRAFDPARGDGENEPDAMLDEEIEKIGLWVEVVARQFGLSLAPPEEALLVSRR